MDITMILLDAQEQDADVRSTGELEQLEKRSIGKTCNGFVDKSNHQTVNVCIG